MNDISKIEQFVRELNSCITPNYVRIQDIFNAEYGYPALDSIRDEICKCIICDLSQSAMTLTNHLLEKTLKFCLTVKHSKENKKEDAKVEDAFVDGIDKYDKKDLSYTINQACKQGLITAKQKKELMHFKDIFRNPYSHASTDIFRNIFVQGKTVTIKDLDNGLEKFAEKCFDSTSDKEIPLKYLLPAQGLFQVKVARDNCLPYFKNVDAIIRNMLSNLK